MDHLRSAFSFLVEYGMFITTILAITSFVFSRISIHNFERTVVRRRAKIEFLKASHKYGNNLRMAADEEHLAALIFRRLTSNEEMKKQIVQDIFIDYVVDDEFPSRFGKYVASERKKNTEMLYYDTKADIVAEIEELNIDIHSIERRIARKLETNDDIDIEKTRKYFLNDKYFIKKYKNFLQDIRFVMQNDGL